MFCTQSIALIVHFEVSRPGEARITMTEREQPTMAERREIDLEKGDHAAQSNSTLDETTVSTIDFQKPPEGSVDENLKEDPLSRTTTGATNYGGDDPFALYPTLSISMSSTRAPISRRNTGTTLSRPLTREETRNTLRSVRSRFTEVRSEFDENVSPHICSRGLMVGRYSGTCCD